MLEINFRHNHLQTPIMEDGHNNSVLLLLLLLVVRTFVTTASKVRSPTMLFMARASLQWNSHESLWYNNDESSTFCRAPTMADRLTS